MTESDEAIAKLIGLTSTYLQDVFECWIAIEKWRDDKGISEKEVIELLLPGDRDFIAHALRLLDIPAPGERKGELENLK